MRMRGIAGIATLLGGVMLTAAAVAAPVVQNPVNTASQFWAPAFNLGSLLMSGFSPAQVNPNPAARVQLTQSHGWDPGIDLFPSPPSLSALSLPVTAFKSSTRFALLPGLNFGVSHTSFGLSGLDNSPAGNLTQQFALRLDPSLRSTGTTAANINWNLTDWSQFAVTASRSTGNPLLLGNVAGPLATGPSPESSALGISARVGFAEGWVTTLAYSEGVSQLDLSQPGTNAVYSDGYGIGVAKTGLFGNDALGIALSRPLQLYGSNSLAAFANNYALSTAPARESDVELGYVTSFLDGTLALQANAAYEVNPAGIRGQNALAAVARAKLNF